MQTPRTLSLAFAAMAALVASCASTTPNLTLDPIGPAGAVANAQHGTGTLLVYSAYDIGQVYGDPPADIRQHSSYHLYDADGKLLRTVSNRLNAWGEQPMRVSLAPGHYRVEARANGYGLVAVPVVIAADQVTIVHLEGSPAWPTPGNFTAANSVRLPDGAVAGWKASGGDANGK